LGSITGGGVEELKVVPMREEAGIALTHQLMDPLCKELLGLMLEAMHHRGFHIFIQRISRSFGTLFRESNMAKQGNGFHLNKPHRTEEELTILVL
jgi:hypothetical protein